jgi:hypothetical protein
MNDGETLIHAAAFQTLSQERILHPTLNGSDLVQNPLINNQRAYVRRNARYTLEIPRE